jgi:hypothetical protein
MNEYNKDVKESAARETALQQLAEQYSWEYKKYE